VTKISTVFTATLILAATSACAQETPADIALRLAGHVPENPDTYFAVKEEVGNAGVQSVQNELWKLASKEAGISESPNGSACRLPGWIFLEISGLELAKASPDAEAWQANRSAVEIVRARRDAIHDKVMKGEEVDRAYAASAGAFRRAATETDHRKAELAQRVGEDQFQRSNTIVLQSRILWAADIVPSLEGYYREAQNGEICKTDRANTDWIKADLAALGWPKISVYGPKADSDAWLLVQHADHDVEFQKSVLVVLEKLLPTKDTRPQNYAYLYDRVAVAEKRPQRYGTQGRCTGPAKWEPDPTENPDDLDRRRADVGLGSEADYAKMFTSCTAQNAAKSNG